MAGDEGSSVEIVPSSVEIVPSSVKIVLRDPEWICRMSMPSVDPRFDLPTRGPRSYDLVSEEETATAYVYKMDKTWLRADEVRVEIRRGHALWVIGQGDEPVKVKLRKNNEMRVREATASMSPDGVLTVVIPKRQRPQKWCEFTDLDFLWFKTVHVRISS